MCRNGKVRVMEKSQTLPADTLELRLERKDKRILPVGIIAELWVKLWFDLV